MLVRSVIHDTIWRGSTVSPMSRRICGSSSALATPWATASASGPGVRRARKGAVAWKSGFGPVPQPEARVPFSSELQRLPLE